MIPKIERPLKTTQSFLGGLQTNAIYIVTTGFITQKFSAYIYPSKMENIYNNDTHVTKLIKWSIYHDIEMLFKSVRILFVNGDNCNFQLVLCTNVPKVRSIRVYHIPFVHQNNSSLLLYTVKIILLENFK